MIGRSHSKEPFPHKPAHIHFGPISVPHRSLTSAPTFASAICRSAQTARFMPNPIKSGAIEAISSKGELQWVLTLPTLLTDACSPTIGTDGTIYVGGSSLFAIK